MALTTVANVKTKLGISSSTHDTVLTSLVAQVDAMISKWLGRNIEEAEYTEYPDGYSSKRIRLKQQPAVEIESVRVDALRLFTASSTLLVADVDYKLVNGMLYRLNGVWPSTRENRWGLLADAQVPSNGLIQVVYTAGYDPVPADVTLAADMLAVKLFRLRKKGEVMSSESLEDYSYSRNDVGGDMMRDVVGLLAPYKRRRI